MKKGLISLDALIAIVILFFIVTWLSNFSVFNIGQVNTFGVQSQTKQLATKIGTQINSFYALKPSAGDYLDLSGIIGIVVNFTADFPLAPEVSKLAANTLDVRVSNFESSYPVSENTIFNPNTKKVTGGT